MFLKTTHQIEKTLTVKIALGQVLEKAQVERKSTGIWCSAERRIKRNAAKLRLAQLRHILPSFLHIIV